MHVWPVKLEAYKTTLTMFNIGIVSNDLDPIFDLDLKHWLSCYGKCSLQVPWQCEVIQGSYWQVFLSKFDLEIDLDSLYHLDLKYW